jgi:hypothetical protein
VELFVVRGERSKFVPWGEKGALRESLAVRPLKASRG